jgi:hypothetical protein
MSLQREGPLPAQELLNDEIDAGCGKWRDEDISDNSSLACQAVVCAFVPCGPRPVDWTIIRATEGEPCG